MVSVPVPSVSENPPRGPRAVQNQCVGILHQNGKDGLVEPDVGYSDKQYGRILIPQRYLNGAPFDMKVVCEIINPQEPAGDYLGKIIEVLGDPMRHDVAILSIMRRFGLSESFPAEVLEEAEEVPLALSEEDVAGAIAAGRMDYRGLTTITIDGEDAKDLDDAISIEPLGETGFRLYVHIADVNHYVKPGSALDREAENRGTSVYLVDRVVPMLPPRLSNSICSLNPDSPRLTMTAVMEVGADGQITGGQICESVIQSDYRTSYKEIQSFLDGEKSERLLSIAGIISDMRALTDILIEKRKRRGALTFYFPETKVSLDKDGKPTSVGEYPIFYSNRMIEEFMILANEFVAEFFWKRESPFVYRVHEEPDPEKIRSFLEVARLYGAKNSSRGRITPKMLSSLMDELAEHPAVPALSQILLRCLAKARYCPDNLEHFGLASACYSHFTSPIRRYPDLFIHRVIKNWLHTRGAAVFAGDVELALQSERGKPRKKEPAGTFAAQAAGVSAHSSEMERNSIDAERATVNQKIAEYMKEFVGEVFDGRISGIFQGGIFVRLENTVEGLVPFRTMDDFYAFDERTMEAAGKRSGHTYHIGDPVSIQVAGVNVPERMIDFVFAESGDSHGQGGGSPRSKAGRDSRGKRDGGGSGRKSVRKSGRRGGH